MFFTHFIEVEKLSDQNKCCLFKIDLYDMRSFYRILTDLLQALLKKIGILKLLNFCNV